MSNLKASGNVEPKHITDGGVNMIHVNPASLNRGDTVFVREYKNKGSGQEPRTHFREAVVHEAKPRVISIRYVDSNSRAVEKVRPSDVFMQQEIIREPPVKAPVTLGEAIADVNLEDGSRVALIPPKQENAESLFGESRAAVEPNTQEFEAWLEMGRAFMHVPQQAKIYRVESVRLKQKRKDELASIVVLKSRYTALANELKSVEAKMLEHAKAADDYLAQEQKVTAALELLEKQADKMRELIKVKFDT